VPLPKSAPAEGSQGAPGRNSCGPLNDPNRLNDRGQSTMDAGKQAFCPGTRLGSVLGRQGKGGFRVAWLIGDMPNRLAIIAWPLSTDAQLVCSSGLAVTFRLLWGPAELTEADFGRRFPRL
jgi:hypothetical protein